jgi:hypothetical protein
MPRGDGTGPAGMGPRTGRGMGYCNGYDVPGFANFDHGRGFGRGFGRGRGFRFWRQPAPVQPQLFYPAEPLTKEEQKKILEDERKAIQEELKAIEEKIKEFEK